jgi:hypothetical protein
MTPVGRDNESATPHVTQRHRLGLSRTTRLARVTELALNSLALRAQEAKKHRTIAGHCVWIKRQVRTGRTTVIVAVIQNTLPLAFFESLYHTVKRSVIFYCVYSTMLVAAIQLRTSLMLCLFSSTPSSHSCRERRLLPFWGVFARFG